MIYKLINGFVFGLALVLMIDFFIFIGLKLHYFDALGIKEYFNVYFFDNQPFLLVGLSAFTLGCAMLYAPLFKWVQGLYLVLLLTSISALYQPIGFALGERFFTKRNLLFSLGKQRFNADLLYEGRRNFYVKRSGIEHLIILSKSDAKIL